MDIYAVLEDLVIYAGHHKACGCTDDKHIESWTIPVREKDIRRIMGRLTKFACQDSQPATGQLCGGY